MIEGIEIVDVVCQGVGCRLGAEDTVTVYSRTTYAVIKVTLEKVVRVAQRAPRGVCSSHR